jgi:hypothetical protein
MSVHDGSLRLGVKSLYSRVFAKADRQRWSDLGNFATSWNERVQINGSLSCATAGRPTPEERTRC